VGRADARRGALLEAYSAQRAHWGRKEGAHNLLKQCRGRLYGIIGIVVRNTFTQAIVMAIKAENKRQGKIGYQNGSFLIQA
jgi:hypothetical protein